MRTQRLRMDAKTKPSKIDLSRPEKVGILVTKIEVASQGETRSWRCCCGATCRVSRISGAGLATRYLHR